MSLGTEWRRATGIAVARWASVADVVVAVVLAGSSVVLVMSGDPSWGRGEPVAFVLALSSTVPVAWRRHAPVSAATIVLLADAGCAYAAAPHESAFQPFVALTLVAYSLGSRTEGTAATVAPPVLLLVFSASSAGVWALSDQSPGNLVPSVLWLAAAWVVGRIVHASTVRNRELTRAYDELTRQRELQAEAAVAIERGRIARELHDVIAHNVSMMVVQAGAAASVLTEGQPDVRAALEAISSTGRQTVDEMRTLLGVLRQEDTPPALRPQPGLADLDSLVNGVRAAGLPVELRVEGERRTLPVAMDVTAYRIVQEGLTNTLKHAGPAHARVTLRFRSDALELEIRDYGGTTPDCGTRTLAGTGPATGPATGHGLVGMRERAAMFGGGIEAAPEPGGFAVRAWLPLTPPLAPA